MAKPNSLRGTQLFIKIGDGATPTETFAHPCGVNAERGIQFQSNGSDIIEPDCDAPDDPAWQSLVKDGFTATVTGAGLLHKDDVPEWDAWYASPDPRNVQIWLGDHGYWAGAFHLTEWSATGDRGSKVQTSLTLRSDGEVERYALA